MKEAGKNSLPKAPDKPVNMDLRAVARLADVSISTVSRSINRKSTVNPKTAKRVRRAIEELDYFPNTQARAVVSGRSRLLGLIVSEITFPEVIQGFEDVAVEFRMETEQQVQYRTLGRTNLNVSVLGFGASPLGHVFGITDPTEGERAVQLAVDRWAY